MKCSKIVTPVHFFALILMISSAAVADPGGEGSKGGGGGEVVASEFVRYARFAVRTMRNKSPRTFSTDDALRIENAISMVQVFAAPSAKFCKSSPTSSGKAVVRCEDAHYYAEKKEIWLNQDTWAAHSCLKKTALVLHEYGRVAGLEDANYAFSSEALASIDFNDMCTAVTTNQSGCSEYIRAREQTLSEHISLVGQCSYAGNYEAAGGWNRSVVYQVPYETQVSKRTYLVKVSHSGFFCNRTNESIIPNSAQEKVVRLIKKVQSNVIVYTYPDHRTGIEEGKKEAALMCQAKKEELEFSLPTDRP